MSDSPRFLDIKRLYHAAVELPPPERAAFLDQACANDQALRLEVESLLQRKWNLCCNTTGPATATFSITRP
jgi:hypothetical protein